MEPSDDIRAMVLESFAAGESVEDIATALRPRHREGSKYPASILMDLAADAYLACGSTREDQLQLDGLADRMLPTKEVPVMSDTVISSQLVRPRSVPQLATRTTTWAPQAFQPQAQRLDVAVERSEHRQAIEAEVDEGVLAGLPHPAGPEPAVPPVDVGHPERNGTRGHRVARNPYRPSFFAITMRWIWLVPS